MPFPKLVDETNACFILLAQIVLLFIKYTLIATIQIKLFAILGSSVTDHHEYEVSHAGKPSNLICAQRTISLKHVSISRDVTLNFLAKIVLRIVQFMKMK
jgi:hypothetical protein